MVVLLGGEVVEPVAQEALRVVEVGGRRGEHGEVAGPAQPLVALRAVGGHVDEVAAHPPDDVAVQLVHQRVRAGERAGAAQVGPDDDGRDRVGVELARPAADLGVAEAVEGEGRLELVVPAGQDEPVGGLRGTQGADAELVVLQHLRVPQRDGGARLAPHPDLDEPDQVLPEVEQGGACGGGPDAGGGDLLLAGHRRSDVRGEPGDVELEGVHARPGAVVEPGLQPAVVSAAGVDGLPVVEVVGHHGARSCPPGTRTRGDHLAVPVGEGDLQLGPRRELRAVEPAVAVPAETAAEPAVAQRHPQYDGVPDERGHVEGAVAQPPLVAAPPGGQQLGRDGLAVDPRLRDAERGQVQPGLDDVAVARVERSLGAEQRRPVELVVGGDHGGVPLRHRGPPGGWGHGSVGV